MRVRAILIGGYLLSVFVAKAATFPPGFADSILLNPTAPTAMAYEPGTGNLFVLEKGRAGTARVLRRDALTGSVTVSATLPCVDVEGERGLLGIAFDPDYLLGSASRYVYLFYTRRLDGTCAIPGQSGSRNRVVRMLEYAGTLGTEELVLEQPPLGHVLHNGGTLRFAPDKTLYVSVGDNFTGSAANPLSRDLSDLRGKILRINRDGSVPLDNPFVGQAGVRPEIWAWGLRNPFRFSIDSPTGDVWIADVGEGTWEELDKGEPAADYGWPCFQGNEPYRACQPAPADPILPVFSYSHFSGPFTGDAIIGGPVYRGDNFPASYQGRIFFADYGSGWMRSAAIDDGVVSDIQLFISGALAIVDIVEAPNGCLGWVQIAFPSSVHETCVNYDRDGDGVTGSAGDCNDVDSTVYPGAPQLCDGRNNDCDAGPWQVPPPNEQDADGDGFRICQGDCDDTRSWVHPGGQDICNGLDDDCDGQIDENSQGVDSDTDGVNNACDDCPLDFNPSQTDFDQDGQGDICDLDDGLIYVFFTDEVYREWQSESGYSSWNAYRGSLTLLRTDGVYTQAPGSSSLYARDCGLIQSLVLDDAPPMAGEAWFTLVTGVAWGVESSLGTNGLGVPRPNSNPCP